MSTKAGAATRPPSGLPLDSTRASGGKEQLGQITRQGDRYLRTLLVHGVRAYLRVVDKETARRSCST